MTQEVATAAHFETLASIVDTFDLAAMNGMLAVAQKQWEQRRPGIVVHSGEGITPPFSLKLGAETVSFCVGLEGGREGSLPTATLLGIIAAKNAAAGQQR